jgi:hypothetical protein
LSKKRSQSKPELIGFLGVGLDGKDGHQRLTKSDHFLLVGGSEETHERMQETAIKFNESLERRGKPLRDATIQEVIELFREAEE